MFSGIFGILRTLDSKKRGSTDSGIAAAFWGFYLATNPTFL